MREYRSKYAIGVDIGGTKTAVGLIGSGGAVLASETIPTDPQRPRAVLERVTAAIRRMMDACGLSVADAKGIGIAAPGPLDNRQGVLVCPPNLPGWHGFALTDYFRDALSLPVRLENDANAAAVAEKWLGAARENDTFIYMTISTGIGSGVFINGKLFSGASGNAGDAGHIVLDPSGGLCRCGQRGCFEHLASGTAIARRASELLGKPLATPEVFALYRQGHPAVTRLVDDVFTTIGMGCVALINLFDPEKLVIGGGVARVGEPLFTAVRSYVATHALSPSGRHIPIVPSRLQEQSGLIGAAAFFFVL